METAFHSLLKAQRGRTPTALDRLSRRVLLKNVRNFDPGLCRGALPRYAILKLICHLCQQHGNLQPARRPGGQASTEPGCREPAAGPAAFCLARRPGRATRPCPPTGSTEGHKPVFVNQVQPRSSHAVCSQGLPPTFAGPRRVVSHAGREKRCRSPTRAARPAEQPPPERCP